MYQLYDKRDDFSFSIVDFPFLTPYMADTHFYVS
jgi:hypothetical protein